MKIMTVPFSNTMNYQQGENDWSFHLDTLTKHSLEYNPWPSFPYSPNVHFSIAHSQNCIFLKYYVVEKNVRAATGTINGAVWEDACVEFFISFDQTGYYNLEFNCIGTALAGFGKSRSCRKLLPEATVEKIKYQSSISRKNNLIHWELTLAIPCEVFLHHSITTLNGLECRANFYKCGDALPDPHFMAWADIAAPQPDFHLPQFFGTLLFE